jgi:hypothetical protein
VLGRREMQTSGGKSEGKRQLERCTCRVENIKMDLDRIGWEGVK